MEVVGDGCAGLWHDLPCLIRQVKYWTPATEPSFFPSGLSSSTPAQRPPENSVLPQNRRLPTCVHTIIFTTGGQNKYEKTNQDMQLKNWPVHRAKCDIITSPWHALWPGQNLHQKPSNILMWLRELKQQKQLKSENRDQSMRQCQEEQGR